MYRCGLAGKHAINKQYAAVKQLKPGSRMPALKNHITQWIIYYIHDTSRLGFFAYICSASHVLAGWVRGLGWGGTTNN